MPLPVFQTQICPTRAFSDFLPYGFLCLISGNYGFITPTFCSVPALMETEDCKHSIIPVSRINPRKEWGSDSGTQQFQQGKLTSQFTPND